MLETALADPIEHSALIATVLARSHAAQRDIDRLDDEIEGVEMSLSDRMSKLEKTVIDQFTALSSKIDDLALANAKRAGVEWALRWIIGMLLTLGVVIATFFSGVFNPPHHG